jgi:uncharacterized protein (TIGR01777 family)
MVKPNQQRECTRADMKIFITGATGFIGRALVLRLRRDGHSIVAWVRDEKRAASKLGAGVEFLRVDCDDATLARTLGDCAAVVNLAGEPLIGRWTAARRARLAESRITVTQRLVDAMAAAARVPRVLVSGSAVGYYGDRGDELVGENSTPADDFLARLCRDWERSARRAEDAGVRVVLLRTGIVLGRGGGALARLLPLFRLALGGPIGSGRQYMPWIHLHDEIEIIVRALDDERYGGPINATAPNPVTNRQFARALGSALRRPALLPLPGFAIKTAMGASSSVLLGGQCAMPGKLLELSFPFAFSTIDEALHDILGRSASVGIRPVDAATAAFSDPHYLASRRPTHELRARTTVHAPIGEVFDFFSHPENLGIMTPASMGFAITNVSGPMEDGTSISYCIRIAGVPVRWKTRIDAWEPGQRFVDAQITGPYACWWHEHRFEADGSGRTIMEDRVLYAPPLGLFGRIANGLFISDALRTIFAYRADAIGLRFGESAVREPERVA